MFLFIVKVVLILAAIFGNFFLFVESGFYIGFYGKTEYSLLTCPLNSKEKEISEKTSPVCFMLFDTLTQKKVEKPALFVRYVHVPFRNANTN